MSKHPEFRDGYVSFFAEITTMAKNALCPISIDVISRVSRTSLVLPP